MLREQTILIGTIDRRTGTLVQSRVYTLIEAQSTKTNVFEMKCMWSGDERAKKRDRKLE